MKTDSHEGDEGLVGGDVVGGEEDGAASESSGESVLGGLELTGFGLWTAAGLSVGSVGVELCFGDLGLGSLLRLALGGATGGSVRHVCTPSVEIKKPAEVLENLDELWLESSMGTPAKRTIVLRFGWLVGL